MERLQQSPTSFDAYELARDVIKVLWGMEQHIKARACKRDARTVLLLWGAGTLPTNATKHLQPKVSGCFAVTGDRSDVRAIRIQNPAKLQSLGG